MRLHTGIGYVAPDDEHHRRGDALRQVSRNRLARARHQRIAYRRNKQKEQQ